MATIIFEQVSVVNSLDASGNKLDVYRYWENDYGKLGRFRASEIIGYGKNVQYQSFNFLADGRIAEKLNKMKLKAGSKLFIVGELVSEAFEGKEGGTINRMVVKVHEARFACGNLKKSESNEKEEQKEQEKVVSTPPKRIPIPTPAESKVIRIPTPMAENREQKEQVKDIPVPRNIPEPATAPEEVDEILNLDMQELFSDNDGFMGLN